MAASDATSKRANNNISLNQMSLAHRADYIATAFQGRLPSLNELKNLTEELGIETARAVFIRVLQKSEIHGPFQRQVRTFDFAQWDAFVPQMTEIQVTVVASNLFQSGRKWGDHVEEWRTWARDLGFTTDVIETDPARSVAGNARIIFEYLKRSPQRLRILVTYGQGASEFRTLLQRSIHGAAVRSVPPELQNIVGWINVCGAFSGASSSRLLLKNGLQGLLSRWRLKLAGRKSIALIETSPQFPLWRQPMPVLPWMRVISLVGVPERAQIPVGMTRLFRELSKSGPNDGVVNVVESAVPTGFILPILGMNHRAPSMLLESYFKRVLGVLACSILLDEEKRSLEKRPGQINELVKGEGDAPLSLDYWFNYWFKT